MTGIDIDARKLGQLGKGLSYISDVTFAEVSAANQTGRFRAAQDYAILSDRDVVFICVPVQLTAARTTDLSQLIGAAEMLQQHLHAGQLVVLHSACPPGSTRKVIQPILERGGLKAGIDFDLISAPERADMGRTDFAVANIPKVVGGVAEQSTARAMRLFSGLGAPIHPVSSPDIAELSVMIENVFRTVNIAFVNELALLAERMGLDIWEALNAAQTKPFGFMPFTPGAGAGGQHMPIDPYLLADIAREHQMHAYLIEAAASLNLAMPFHVISLLEQALGHARIAMREARVMVVGVAYKRDVEDSTHAPARQIIELLIKRGAQVSYYDPYVPRLELGGNTTLAEKHSLVSTNLSESNLERTHGVVIVTGHHAVDYANIVRYARAVVDCCNATAGVQINLNNPNMDHVIRLGAGR